jgi:hypothetical protein
MKNNYRGVGVITMTNQTAPAVLTRKNAATALGICCTTLDRIDDLPCVNIRGRVFYRPVDIETWLEKHAKPKAAKRA